MLRGEHDHRTPTALLFLGIATLAYALAPRASSGIGYGFLAVTFLWQLVGSLLGPPRWVLDLTPFVHIGLAPAYPVHLAAAAIMTGIGLLTGGGAPYGRSARPRASSGSLDE